MQSKSEFEGELRVCALVVLLFLAGASLPSNQLREMAAQPYQGGTWLFVSFLLDLLQKPGVLQTLYKHPDNVSSLLNYFSMPENFNDSYWWLQHRPQLLELFADEGTFLILANSPWLFRPLRSLFEYSPPEFQKAISNRTFFNDLLRLGSDYPELRTILSSNPLIMVVVIDNHSLLPRIRTTLNNTQIKQILIQNPTLFPYFLANPTLTLPISQEWVLILQPSNNTSISRTTTVLILISSSAPFIGVTAALVQNNTIVRPLNGSVQPINTTNVSLYNATLNPTNMSLGKYYLQLNASRLDSEKLTAQIIIQVSASSTSQTAYSTSLGQQNAFVSNPRLIRVRLRTRSES